MNLDSLPAPPWPRLGIRRNGFIKQAPKSKVCGQIALSHLLGIPLDESVALIGHQHTTKPREVISAVRKRGLQCPNRLQVVRGPVSMRNGLAKLVESPSHSWWHWVAFVDGLVWDGYYGIAPGVYCWPPQARITSILSVEGI